MILYLKEFFRKETVFCAAFVLAAASVPICPPSKAWLGYVNVRTIELLFCLMCVVAGLRSAGVLDRLAEALVRRAGSAKKLALVMIFTCFFTAMLITNDVALISFVPLTGEIFGSRDKKRLVWIVVMETVAANLGSMATPVGNPQNIFLYSWYSMRIGEFFSFMLPFVLICFAIVAAVSLTVNCGTLEKKVQERHAEPSARGSVVYAALFLICILTVLKLVNNHICLAVTAAAVLVYDRKVLARVDYFLLLTFVCFFVFVGNVSQAGEVKKIVTAAVHGREIITGALASQIISNVPAAVMLAPFTESSHGLMLGVNIGGLGTPVASLASLISYKQYCAFSLTDKKLYFRVFLCVNFALLALLLTIACIFFGR